MKSTIVPEKGYVKINPSEEDNRFPSFMQGFNRRWDSKNCEAVYLCFTAEGATDALTEAVNTYGDKVRFKSGGHCYENFVFNPETKAIIDVTPMSGYGHEEGKGYYLESGNTNWSAFSAIFRDYGKVLPSGSCYSVGLGGHICGGGYGLMSRLNGLTVDWLTGVEVAVKDNAEADSRLLYVSEDDEDKDNLDLYWAHCGGGGGNFGCITKYYFKRLPEAPKTAFVTSIAFSWDLLTSDLLYNLIDWYSKFAAREDNWRQFGLFVLNHQSAKEIHLTVQTSVMIGEDEDEIREQFIVPMLEQIIEIMPFTLMTRPGVAHLANLFNPSNDTQKYTFKEVVQTLNGSGSNQRFKNKSSYHTKMFTPEQVDTLFTHLNMVPEGSDMSQSVIQIDSYGGMVNTVPPDRTAVYQRSSIMKIQWQTYWTEDQDDYLYLEWINSVYTEFFKNSGGTPDPEKDPTDSVEGCYYNYPDVDLNGPDNDKEPALKLYFGTNLPRLKGVKHRWDPNNYFNSLQSI